ncbi:hypothetical protein CPB84DRAFT_1779626 [Gymnopilus junonius]|uniref:Uncharacterized protein n=1 Tax=Gymnopilus junonius TaxID=109634 RepID=A0A9P5NK56_GYMJU|nr:hypothetical protein CPB84DRAFT_1779626 [Gymnopilus junonius]
MSVRSGSSYKTTLSQSKSISSLPKLAPSSPLSAQFRTSSRKSSFSSISSQATSVPSSVTLARSTSHLALRKTNEISGKAIIESSDHGISSYENADQDSELLNIRKRREDLTTRYTARLEFLRAKLKGAELHEKLLRK